MGSLQCRCNLRLSQGSAGAGFISDQTPKKKGDTYEMGDHEWMVRNRTNFKMQQNYYTSINVIRALVEASKSAIDSDVSDHFVSGIEVGSTKFLPTQIILVGSVLSTLSFIGYSAYSARYNYILIL